MLETGQPLHFYDLAKIPLREITVKTGLEETYTALDGIDYAIKPEDIMITTGGKAIGIAGVMGGDDSKIDEETKDLISSMLSGKSFHEVKGRMSKVVKTREDAYLLLDLLESRLRDIMTGKDSLRTSMGKDEAIRNIEITEDIRRALNGNAVVGYAMRRLVLEIQENQ